MAMANMGTQTDPGRGSATPARSRPSNGRVATRAFVVGETEARPGIMTTEFWLTIFSAAAVVIFAYVSDTFTTDTGWALFAGIIAAYVLSRGLAKSGSREGPFVIGSDDGDRDGS
jgi:hypothetical protein